MKYLRKTKRALKVNGETVLQRAEAHKRLLGIAAQADISEGIRQGLQDAKERRLRPAREVLEEFRRAHRIPR